MRRIILKIFLKGIIVVVLMGLLFLIFILSYVVNDDIIGYMFEMNMCLFIIKGVLMGYGDNVYVFDKLVIRVEFVIFIVRVLNLLKVDLNFEDVLKIYGLYDGVSRVYGVKIINGCMNEIFLLNDVIICEEMLIMVKWVLDYKNIKVVVSLFIFIDKDSINYKEYV